jgi:hypothetical protein
MVNNKTYKLLLIAFVLVLISISCDKESQGETILTGTVENMVDGEAIFPAFLIFGDELLATTQKDGVYEIKSLEPGSYTLVCSAIDYGDKTIQVEVSEGETVSIDFQMSPDDRKGRVYGEFHNNALFLDQLTANPEKATWSGKELFDGVSGATIETSFDMPSSTVLVGDSLYAYADGYGQFWFDIQSGTYPVTGTSSGYNDTMLILRIEPDTEVYANYMLSGLIIF